MRRAARRDSNEQAIIDALRKVGASVQQLSEEDVPDLLVGYQRLTAAKQWERVNVLMEVKVPGKPLRPGQSEWHACWRGQVCRVESVDEALRAIGAIV